MTADQSERTPNADDSALAPLRRRSRIMAGLCLIWIAVLAYLAIATANPVMLNLRQLDQSPLVVVAKVTDRNEGRIEVLEELIGKAPAGELLVERLAQTNVKNGEAYLFPIRLLSNRGKTVKVIITPPEEVTPDGRLARDHERLARPGDFVWPMSDETRRRFQEYLDRRSEDKRNR